MLLDVECYNAETLKVVRSEIEQSMCLFDAMGGISGQARKPRRIHSITLTV